MTLTFTDINADTDFHCNCDGCVNSHSDSDRNYHSHTYADRDGYSEPNSNVAQDPNRNANLTQHQAEGGACAQRLGHELGLRQR